MFVIPRGKRKAKNERPRERNGKRGKNLVFVSWRRVLSIKYDNRRIPSKKFEK